MKTISRSVMLKRIFAALFILGLLTGASPVQSDTTVETGEAYVEPTFEELTQTTLALGGLDINQPIVAEEYMKMMFCNIYREIYKDDFALHKIAKQVAARYNSKKEYPRRLFQVVGKIQLGKYDFVRNEFPFVNQEEYKGVGSVVLYTWKDYKPYCPALEREWENKDIFPTNISVILSQPLTLTSFKIPPQEANKILALFDRLGNNTRELYIRFRLRVQALYGVTKTDVTRTDFGGNIVSIDLFYDKDMTMWLASIPLEKP